MALTMFDYIEETPVACKKIIEKRKEITTSFVSNLKTNHVTRIVCVASGSSYNAVNSARFFVERYLKIPLQVVAPYMFTHYESFYDQHDLILGISEGGRSASTIGAMKKARETNLNCMVLTNNLKSPITKECQKVIDLSCGVETVGYVTKGYVSTVLDIMLFALESALALGRIEENEYPNVIRQIEQSAELMPIVIRAAEDWYTRNQDHLRKTKRLMVVGFGPNFGTALEGALKVGETVRIPATGYELEEFMHGPYLELTELPTVIFINTKGKAENRLMDLYSYTSKITAESYLLTNKAGNSPKFLTVNHSISEEITPLFLAIPFQVLAYKLCCDHGINLQIEHMPDFDNALNSKIDK